MNDALHRLCFPKRKGGTQHQPRTCCLIVGREAAGQEALAQGLTRHQFEFPLLSPRGGSGGGADVAVLIVGGRRKLSRNALASRDRKRRDLWQHR